MPDVKPWTSLCIPCSLYGTIRETNTAIGTLYIAMVDAETEELLWISHGAKELVPKSNNFEENKNKSVANMFEEFPIEHEVESIDEEDLLSNNK